MIPVPAGSRVWLATGYTELRKGFDGLAALVQDHLRQDAFSGQAFVFRGRQGRLIKVLWWDGQGLCLFAKRLEKGRFIWPATPIGAGAALTPAQLSMLLEASIGGLRSAQIGRCSRDKCRGTMTQVIQSSWCGRRCASTL
jgi:transposase